MILHIEIDLLIHKNFQLAQFHFIILKRNDLRSFVIIFAYSINNSSYL